eukprot:4657260-Amphidinium_carterae.1
MTVPPSFLQLIKEDAEQLAHLSGVANLQCQGIHCTAIVGRASCLAQVVVEVSPFASALWAALTAAERA